MILITSNHINLQTIDRNGATITVGTDYLTGTTTAVSLENRTVTSLFDLDTLLTTPTQVTGLNAIEYSYDDYGGNGNSSIPACPNRCLTAHFL